MSMSNNDVLIRLRYALDIKETDMLEMFRLGGVELTREDIKKILVKSKAVELDEEETILCNDTTLAAFLNGLVAFKRGPQEGQPAELQKNTERINNLILKKVKIALSLTSEDMLEIFQSVGLTVSKGEMGALLRKQGHKNYKECGDKYARNFLKGLALRYRG